MPKYRLDELAVLATNALTTAGASRTMAEATIRALLYADSHGLPSHGLSRIVQYTTHLRNGRANGAAVAKVVNSKAAACLIDADEGLAFPACELAIVEAIARAKVAGVCFVGVSNSHHFGAAAYHVEAVAKAGMVGLAFSNSPSAMPAWGGKRGIFGTNPIAAAFPREHAAPILIDLSLSEVARGKLMIAAKKGESIPLGWALDKDGKPTTDPKAGMEGTMMPAGGVKGAMLAMVVELLCCALTGAAFGFEADSFFVDAGNRPHLGQAFLVIDPSALAGQEVFYARIETLVAAMLAEDSVRLPGVRRAALADNAREVGVDIPDALMADLQRLAAAAS
jgi:(2R)-3-sulfolactate dehydrogenase (NADP+)